MNNGRAALPAIIAGAQLARRARLAVALQYRYLISAVLHSKKGIIFLAFGAISLHSSFCPSLLIKILSFFCVFVVSSLFNYYDDD